MIRVDTARSSVDDQAGRSAWSTAALFILLTFACSWTPWLVLVATSGDPFAGPGSRALWIAGGYGPSGLAICDW